MEAIMFDKFVVVDDHGNTYGGEFLTSYEAMGHASYLQDHKLLNVHVRPVREVMGAHLTLVS